MTKQDEGTNFKTDQISSSTGTLTSTDIPNEFDQPKAKET